MLFIKTIKDKIERINYIYEGSIYQLKENESIYLNRRNWEKKSNLLEEKIFYKRPFFTDLYVKEITSGKRIPTFVKRKVLRLPVVTFVPIERKGKKFDEIIQNPKRKEYASWNNLNTKKDKIQLDNELNTLSTELENYKEINKSDIINNYINKGREMRSKSKNSIFYWLSEVKKRIKKDNKKQKITKTEKLDLWKNNLINKVITKKNNVEDVIIEEKLENNKKDETPINKEIDFQHNINKTTDELIETDQTKKSDNEIKCEKKNSEDVLEKMHDETTIINRTKKIEELKELKKQINICDYWQTKKYPRKEILTIETSNKNQNEVVKEMVNKSTAENVVKAKLDGITLTTQILKTEEELLAYYMYKKYNTIQYINDNSRSNCYKMIRADRNIKKRS